MLSRAVVYLLQEGCRYNALHIAVRADRPDMCELILNTVGNADFIKLLYGDECKSYVDRAQIMLDLYLNTPDKGLNETPLHFAVKFGLKNAVRVLVSYPCCIKTLANKYKQLPIDVRDKVFKDLFSTILSCTCMKYFQLNSLSLVHNLLC